MVLCTTALIASELFCVSFLSICTNEVKRSCCICFSACSARDAYWKNQSNFFKSCSVSVTESAYAEHTPAFSFLNWALFVSTWWKWQQKWRKSITSHPCIILKNWWSSFIHTSSLHHANPVRRKAEVPCFVQSDTERMSRFSSPKASVLTNMSQLFSFQIWRVLCNHRAINSSKFPFQGPHDAAHLFLYLL